MVADGKATERTEARNEMQDGVLFKMKNDPVLIEVGGFTPL